MARTWSLASTLSASSGIPIDLHAPVKISGGFRKMPRLLSTMAPHVAEPILRAEYLLKEHGFDIGEQKSSHVPPELLEEVFELNMALEEVESSRPQLEEARRKFVAMREEIDRELFAQFAALRRETRSSVA